MSITKLECRISEIESEENEIAEREYRYGYIGDRQYCAKLFSEKIQLMKQLNVLKAR